MRADYTTASSAGTLYHMASVGGITPRSFAIFIALEFALMAILSGFNQFTWEAFAAISAAILVCVWFYDNWRRFQPKRQRLLAVVVLTIVLSAAGLIVWKYSSQPIDLSKYEGTLYPSDQPRPSNPCSGLINQSTPLVLLGGNGYVIRNNVATINVQGKTLVRIGVNNGALNIVTLRIYNENGNIIARIDGSISENEFWIAPDVRKQRPNESRLIVYNKKDDRVLDIEFLNDSTVRIRGILYYSGNSVHITDNRVISYPQVGEMIGNCIGSSTIHFSSDWMGY